MERRGVAIGSRRRPARRTTSGATTSRSASRPARPRRTTAPCPAAADPMMRPAVVLAAGAVLVAVALPFAARQSDRLTGGGYEVPGSQAKQAEDLIAAGVPPDFRPTSRAGVLTGPRGADYRPALRALADAARRTKGVTLNPVV